MQDEDFEPDLICIKKEVLFMRWGIKYTCFCVSLLRQGIWINIEFILNL